MGRQHPAAASGHLKAPSISYQRCCKNLLWKLLVVHVCLPLDLFLCGSTCVLDAGPQSPLQYPLRFLRTGLLKAWPPLP